MLTTFVSVLGSCRTRNPISRSAVTVPVTSSAVDPPPVTESPCCEASEFFCGFRFKNFLELTCLKRPPYHDYVFNTISMERISLSNRQRTHERQDCHGAHRVD